MPGLGWIDTITVDRKCWADLQLSCMRNGWKFDGDCDLSNDCKIVIDILADQCEQNMEFDDTHKMGE